MIGRAAFGNPWVFSKKPEVLNLVGKLPLIKMHLKFLIKTKGEKIALLEIRKHLAAYVKAIPGAAKLRTRLVRVTSQTEVNNLLDEIANI